MQWQFRYFKTLYSLILLLSTSTIFNHCSSPLGCRTLVCCIEIRFQGKLCLPKWAGMHVYHDRTLSEMQPHHVIIILLDFHILSEIVHPACHNLHISPNISYNYANFSTCMQHHIEDFFEVQVNQENINGFSILKEITSFFS